ncbi:MAG: hypothetical protein ACODAB_10120 [Gemmatimonadota bacterium]
MADVKVAPSEQWTEPEEARAAGRPSRGVLVADGDFYRIDTGGTPDAYFRDDGDFVQVDPTASSASAGRRITVARNRAEIGGD